VICFLAGFIVSSVSDNSISDDDVEHAGKLIGLSFSGAKRDSMIDGLNEQLANYQNIRTVPLSNQIPPAILFNPIPPGFTFATVRRPIVLTPVDNVPVPARDEELAFYSVAQLSWLLQSRKITSVQLTRMYLNRLRKYGPRLHCTVTLTDQLALSQAERADEEIAQGKYRGPLQGIPYGVKDVLSTQGYKTTWGSVAFKDQMIDKDATVIQRLEDAGAVLVAKLSMGELAWGDIWFGGQTRNPWDTTKGSSGSSSGSASATAAGLVAFSIGTETYGSIVSPSTVCGTTGLRPTYGRVSREGAMALSWSMDKIGPICRTVEDCAIVFDAIFGPDGEDETLYDVPFNYTPTVKLSGLRIGYLKNDFDSVKENKSCNDSTLSVLQRLGANLIPIELPKYPVNDLAIILTAEAGAAFDDLTRSGREDLLVRQIKDAWPNVFRASRFIPAVEYIQANRIRSLLIQDMQKLMETIDVYVAPSFEGNNLLLTNLTGHPCVVLPNGFSENGVPVSVCFIGKLFGEANLLAVAKQYQDATVFHRKHPALP
jgi:Asp-tRNA(Asn)/Glu-tRNA(Gln) amidotransferase A subunit family amidase